MVYSLVTYYLTLGLRNLLSVQCAQKKEQGKAIISEEQKKKKIKLFFLKLKSNKIV